MAGAQRGPPPRASEQRPRALRGSGKLATISPTPAQGSAQEVRDPGGRASVRTRPGHTLGKHSFCVVARGWSSTSPNSKRLYVC